MAKLRFTILGCGSSGGVPRLGNNWGACDPSEPKNERLRCSLLVERFEGDNVTRVLIDTSPDMRQQLLRADIGDLDAVVFTHEHADHLHGLDDLRMIVINRRAMLPVYAPPAAQTAIMARFGYAFVTPQGSPYPPILEMNTLGGTTQIEGAGGTITFEPIDVEHGAITATCYRVEGVAYAPDVSAIPDWSKDGFSNLDCWIIDALRYAPHPSHANVEQALAWIDELKPKRAILTNLHNDLDYKTLKQETPEHVEPAFDGMTLEYEI